MQRCHLLEISCLYGLIELQALEHSAVTQTCLIWEIWGWVIDIFGFVPTDTGSTVFKYRICISLEWDGHPTLGNNCCFYLLPPELHHSLAEGSPTADPKSNVLCLVTNLEQDIQACSFPWLRTRQRCTSGWTPFLPENWASVPGLHSEVSDILANSKSICFPWFFIYPYLFME